MSNYRITIEPLRDDTGLPEELMGGFCVEGFTLIHDDGDHHSTVAIQHMTTMDVAKAIAACAPLRAAARLAEGLREAAEIEGKAKMDSFMDKLRKFTEKEA